MKTSIVSWLITVGVLSSIVWRIATISLASGEANSVKATQLKSNRPIRENVRVELPEGIFAVDLSPDGGTIAAGTQHSILQLRDAKTGSLKFNLEGHEGDVVDIEFNRNGEKLASVAFDGIRIWNVSQGSLERLLPTKRGTVTWVNFCPDGRTLISGGPIRDIPVQAWNVSTGEELAPFPQQSGASKCAAISQDGRLLATSHRDSQNVETINLWEVEHRKLFGSVCLHHDETKLLAFMADGHRLITADQGGEIVIWDPVSGGCYSSRFPQQKGDITAFAISRDGSLLVSASRGDRYVHVWELATCRELSRFAGHTSIVKGIALSRDGQFAVTGGFDSQVMLWNTLPEAPDVDNLDSMDLDQIKEHLTGDDALIAQQLIKQLAERPERGRRVAKQIVQPLSDINAQILIDSIGKLSNSDFSRRQEAMKTLKLWGDLAEPALRQARRSPATFTTLQRIDAILEEIHDRPCSPEKRSNLRAIQLLRWIGDSDSIRVLAQLATGPEIDLCTLAAREGLSNLGAAENTRSHQVEPSFIKQNPTVTLPSNDSQVDDSSLTDDAAQELADQIDREIESSWDADAVVVAPPADDFEWIRRINLDLIGRIPLAYEVEDFVDEVAPDRKRKVIDRLLQSDDHLRHQVQTWQEIFLGPPSRDGLFARAHSFGPAMEQWLTERFRQHRRLDEIVHELLTSPIPDETNDSVAKDLYRIPHALGYFLRQDDLSPSVLGSDCSRMFLGIRLECAQCHDHPFAEWSQDQFWGFAAFFSGVRSKSRVGFGMTMPLGEDRNSASIQIPNTERVIPVRFLDGTTPTSSPTRSSRESLADWITSAENPYFARTMVNRVWAQFFGQGLAEPLDDINVGTPNARRVVIDLLAHRFQERKFDLKFLIHAITLTRAYQRTSRLTHNGQKETEFLAKMPVRSLSGRSLHDSLVRAAGFAPFAVMPRDERQFQHFFSPHRFELIRRAYSDTPKSETERSMLDSLHQMNGEFMETLTQSRRDETVDSITRIQGTSNSEKINSIFLCTLSRKPSSDELRKIEDMLNRDSGSEDSFTSSDLLWAILNSAEFNSNH